MCLGEADEHGNACPDLDVSQWVSNAPSSLEFGDLSEVDLHLSTSGSCLSLRLLRQDVFIGQRREADGEQREKERD